MIIEAPLFPLNTVLFPGGMLPLRIFEKRYVDMVRDCMSGERSFGVVLIRHGREAGVPAEPERVGTLARIRDFDRGADGLLNIVAHGERRFEIVSRSVRPDGLQIGQVELLPEPVAVAVPARHAALATLLRDALPRLPPPWNALPDRADDADWLGGRLAELLPLDLHTRQALLETTDPLERLATLATLLEGAGQRS